MERCPHCDAELVPDSQTGALSADAPWTQIAQMASVAEAGYLCDVLTNNAITARLQEVDDFDAISGAWQKLFIVSVPVALVDRAIEQMQREKDAAADDSDFSDDLSAESIPPQNYSAHSHQRAKSNHRNAMANEDRVPDDFFLESTHDRNQMAGGWFPIAIALVAGGLVSWMASDWLTQNGEAERSRVESPLWNALKESEGTWTITIPKEQQLRSRVTRRLRYDATADVFVLEEDLDGDLRMDRRRKIHPQTVTIEP